MRQVDLNRLCKGLGYTFKDRSLLKKALTHRSVSSENNECFEFVGDSILNFAIAYALYQTFPDCNEGELSRLRSFLVRGECLTELAMELNLGDYLSLGPGELKTGGFRRASILADALEAVFAAIFMDSDFETVNLVITRLFQDKMHDKNWQQDMKDFKTGLQEYLQKQKISLPVYELIRIEESDQDPIFYVNCSVSELAIVTQGCAATRRKAEQMAAKLFLQSLETGETGLPIKKKYKK